MPNIFIRIKKFLTKDVKNESEAKDLAVLLRLLCILSALYIFCNSIYFAFIGSYLFAILSVPIIGLYCGVFIETYENKTKFALNLFNYTSIATAVIFTIFTGWDKDYQWLLCIVCLLVFFSIEQVDKYRRNNMEFILITMIVIAIVSHIFGPFKKGNSVENTVFSVISALYYGLSVILISYNFSRKFNASEIKLRNYNQRLQEMASLDALTQLPNRRSMNEYMAQIVFEKEKKGDIFCVAIADLDFFKKINDQYGHDAGDFILTECAKIFTKTMEGRGKVARWGGEEFLFCFNDLNIDQSFKILDEMRKNIDEKVFTYKENNIHITITIGLEEFYHITGIESTISNADKKLYEGKHTGRNRVVV